MKPAALLACLPLCLLAAAAQAQHDPHAGHAAAPQAQHPHDPHAHHDQAQHAAPPTGDDAPPPPAPHPFPIPSDADRAAAFPDLHGMDMADHMQEDPLIGVLRFDQLESVEGDAAHWSLSAGLGRSYDKLWLRSEGHREDGHGGGSVHLLWAHATGPWWDRVIGLRQDFGGGPSRQWLAVGVQGHAPYLFEVEATAYLGESGRLAAQLEVEYEVLLSNRLILQPKLETMFHGKADPRRGIGRGLSEAELGLRLRYEFSRRFAPYVGYAWSREFGDTADLSRAHGESPREQGWVAGLRFWF